MKQVKLKKSKLQVENDEDLNNVLEGIKDIAEGMIYKR